MRVAGPNQTVAELLSMLDEPGGQTVMIRDQGHSALVVSSTEYERFRAY